MVFLAVDLTRQMSIAGLESVDSNTVIANTEDSQETVYQTNHVGSSFSYTFGPADGLIPGQAYIVRTLHGMIVAPYTHGSHAGKKVSCLRLALTARTCRCLFNDLVAL